MKLRNRGIALLFCAGGLVALAGAVVKHGMGRDQLRFIVQRECVPDWLKTHDPAPCISVSMTGRGSAAQGFVLLADRKGGAHFLLIPTQSIPGIESPDLWAPGAFNYFDAAWKARTVLDTVVGDAVPRTAVGLAVNSIWARSQDQLHIHISCLRRSIYDALQGNSERIGPAWSPISVRGLHYQAMRIMGRELGPANPFELLAGRPGAKGEMGRFTLLVAGMDFKEGPGFVALAGASLPGTELMLDPSCALAGGRRNH